MKKKYYILITIAVIAALFFGIPFYYYKKGYEIAYDSTHGGKIVFCVAPDLGKSRQRSKMQEFIDFAIKYWLHIVPKRPYWEMYNTRNF